MPRVVNGDEQRNRVIDAAWQVVVEDGFEAATMRRIASRAGCTTGLVTHHFSGKEDLVIEMVSRVARLAHDRIVRALQTSECRGIAKVRSVLIETTPIDPQVADEWRIWLAMWDLALSNTRIRLEWNRRTQGFIDLILAGVEEAAESGELSPEAPIRQLADALGAFQYGLAISAVLTPERASATYLMAMIDQQLAMILQTYGAHDPSHA